MGRLWVLILGAIATALEEPYPYLHGGNWTGDASSFVDPMRALLKTRSTDGDDPLAMCVSAPSLPPARPAIASATR